ncbi:hypothetical protein VTI74DRAFT_9019 [Chaetomium olivicolor]
MSPSGTGSSGLSGARRAALEPFFDDHQSRCRGQGPVGAVTSNDDLGHDLGHLVPRHANAPATGLDIGGVDVVTLVERVRERVLGGLVVIQTQDGQACLRSPREEPVVIAPGIHGDKAAAGDVQDDLGVFLKALLGSVEVQPRRDWFFVSVVGFAEAYALAQLQIGISSV